MSTSTLTSLALLKVNIDQGKDYLDYLRPFVLQVLVDHKPDSITGKVVKGYIREKFGLEIPERTVEIVLKRMSKHNLIKREHGVYLITENLPDPQLAEKQSRSKRHIDSVLHSLREFSKKQANRSRVTKMPLSPSVHSCLSSTSYAYAHICEVRRYHRLMEATGPISYLSVTTSKW